MEKRFRIDGIGRFFIDYDPINELSKKVNFLALQEPQLVDITGLLPDGWSFYLHSGGRFRCLSNNSIMVPEQHVKSAFGLTGTLHEIGHARDPLVFVRGQAGMYAHSEMRREYAASKYALEVLDDIRMPALLRAICYVDIEAAMSSHLPSVERKIMGDAEARGLEPHIIQSELMAEHNMWIERHIRTRQRRMRPWYMFD